MNTYVSRMPSGHYQFVADDMKAYECYALKAASDALMRESMAKYNQVLKQVCGQCLGRPFEPSDVSRFRCLTRLHDGIANRVSVLFDDVEVGSIRTVVDHRPDGGVFLVHEFTPKKSD